MATVQTTETNRDSYRVVTTYHYSGAPLVVPSVPMPRKQAMRLFDALVSSGSFKPDTHRRVRVLAEDECERWGYR